MQDNPVKLVIDSGLLGLFWKGNGRKLLIGMHGFTGSPYEHLWSVVGRRLSENGVDVFLLPDLYWRKFDEVSLSDHIEDMNNAISHFSGKYDEIHVAGHSLGGLAILHADQSRINSLIFIDPTTGFSDPSEKRFHYSECLGKWISRRRFTTIISDRLVKEWGNTNIMEMAGKINVPAKFIFAGNYNKKDLWQDALKLVRNKEVSVVMSNHTFTVPDRSGKVADEILKWVGGGWK